MKFATYLGRFKDDVMGISILDIPNWAVKEERAVSDDVADLLENEFPDLFKIRDAKKAEAAKAPPVVTVSPPTVSPVAPGRS